MSKHTIGYLHEFMRVGFGHRAWWFNESAEKANKEPSHYAKAVPLAAVRRLFDSVKVTRSVVSHTYTDGEGNRQVVQDEKRTGVLNAITGDIFGYFNADSDFRDFNKDLTDNVRNLTSGSVDIGSAGILDFGARAFLSLEIPQTMHNKESGIAYRPRLLAATALDGTLATTFKRVYQLPVCDNTLAIGLAEKSDSVKVKHTKNSGLRLKDAAATLALLEATADEINAELTALVSTPVTPAQWSAFLDTVCPVTTESTKHAVTQATNRRDALANLWVNDKRVSPWAGTALGVLQAMNTYRQHLAIRRGLGEGDKDALRAERNMTDVLSGKSGDADRETMETLGKVLQTA